MAQKFLTGVKITAGDENTLYLDTATSSQQTTIFYQVDGSYKYQQRVGANWELYNYSTSNWDFHIQGSTGYLGLGHNDPKARLHLSGDNSAKSAIRQSRTGTVIWDQAIDSSGRLQWGTRSSEGGTRTVHFTLDDNGKVGVGIGAPEEELSVNGSIQLVNQKEITWADDGDGNTGRVSIRGNEDDDWILFRTDNQERMRLTNTGLGIGITSPDSKLHVEQAAVTLNTTNLDNSSVVAASFTIPDATLSGGEGVALALGMNGRGRSYIATEFDSSNKDATDLVFYTENGGTIVERMRIDQTGYTTFSGYVTTNDLRINTTSQLFSAIATFNGDTYTTGAYKLGTSSTYVGKIHNNSGKFAIETDGDRDILIGSSNNDNVISIDTSALSTTFAGDITVGPKNNATVQVSESGNSTVKMLAGSVGRVGTYSNHNLNLMANSNTVLTLDTSQNATFAASVHLDSDSAQLQFGDDNDMQIFHNGANGEINIGTGDFTIDSAGDITLDAAGNDIRFFKDTVEYGKFKSDSNHFAIYSSVENKDMIFRGNDGGSTIDALTLDMSEAGAAIFNAGVEIPGYITHTGDGDTKIGFNVDDTIELRCGGNLQINADVSRAYLRYQGTTKLYTDSTGIYAFGSRSIFAADTIVNSFSGTAGVEVYKNAGDSVLMVHQDDGNHESVLHFRTGGNDTKLIVPATTNALQIDTETTADALVLSLGGHLGLGAANSPSRLLHIDNTASTDTAAAYFYTNAQHTGTTEASVFAVRSDHGSGTGDLIYGRSDGTGNLLVLNKGGADKLVVDDDGNATFAGDIHVGANYVGRDGDNYIGFVTDDLIKFRVAGGTQVKLSDGLFTPQTDSDIDLGSSGVRFKDAYVDTITVTDTGSIGGLLTHARTQGTVTESALSGTATASAKLTTNYTYTSTNSNGTYARQDYLTLAGSGGSFQNAAGYQMKTDVTSTGTGTAIKNIMSRVHTASAGDINTVANFSTHNEFSGTGNVGTWAGLAIADIGTSFENTQTITNTYGIKIGDITHGTQTNAPYAIYTGTERSQLSHNVLTTTGSHGRIHSTSGSLFLGGGGTTLVQLSGKLIPDSDSSHELGQSNRYWSHAYIDAITTTGNVTVGGSGTFANTITSTKSSTHTAQGSISAANAHLDLYNSLEANTDQKGSIITFTDNYYDGSNYHKTTRAAIKGGTDTVGNTADGYLEFYTDSAGANSPALALRLDHDQNAAFEGKVGIGTEAAAGMELHVNGNIRVDASDGIKTRGIYADYFSTGQDMTINAGNTGDILFADTAGTRVIIDDSHNMGIGTSSPGARLNVYTGGNSIAAAAVLQHDTFTADRKVGLGFELGDTQIKAAVGFISDADTTGQSHGVGNLIFCVDSNDDAAPVSHSDEKMRITHAGNIGMGISSPDRNLHVWNASAGSVTASADAQLVVENSSVAAINLLSPATSHGQILFGDPDDNDAGQFGYDHSENAMYFKVNGSSTKVLKIRSDSASYIDTGDQLFLGTDSDYFGSATTIQLDSGANDKDVGIRARNLYLYSYANGSDANLVFGDGTGNWGIFAGDTDFKVYNYGTTSNPMVINKATNKVTFIGDLSVEGNTVLGNALTDKAVVHGHFGIGDDNYPKIAYPGQNALWGGSGSTTGQIVIDLPGTLGNYDMMYMEIDVYEYSSDHASKIIIGGHNWNSGGNSNTGTTQWYNTGVTILGRLQKPVYLGRRNDGSNERRCIAIGAIDSTWSYSTVHVAKVHGAEFYSSAIDWVGDWNIAQTTDNSYFTANPTTNYNDTTSITFRTPRGIAVGDGSAAGPSITNTGDANTGMYWPADHQLGFAVNGSRKLYMSETEAFFQNLSSGVSINAGGIDVTGNSTFSGSVTASSFIKSGGTSSQYLMADGSVSTSSFNGGTITNSILIDYTGDDGNGNDAGLKVQNDGSDWGVYVRKDSAANFGLRIDSGGANAFQIAETVGGSPSFRIGGDGDIEVVKNIVASGDIGMATGHSSGKFAVMNSSVHPSFDLYNNGTTYFNGATTIDDSLTMSGTNANIYMPSLKGVRLGDRATEFSFELPYFTHSTADLAADIILGDTPINGILELKLTSGYSNQNAVGEAYFKWIVGWNANNVIWYTPQLIERRITHQSTQIYVADPAWDSTNSRYYIRVYHKNSNGNRWEGTLKNVAQGTAGNLLGNISIGSLLTSTSTANSHPVGHYLSDQTGDMNLILQSKTAGDPTLTFNSEAANRSGIINFEDQGTITGAIQYLHNADMMKFLTGGTGSNHEELILHETTGATFRTQVGIGVTPTTLLNIRGTGDAIRVESTNTGDAGAQMDLLHFTSSPADNDITGLINFGGYYSGTDSAYSSSIRSVWTDVSAKHGQLEFWTRDGADWAQRLKIDHDGTSTFAGLVGIGATNPGDRQLYVEGATSIVEIESTTANQNASVWFRSNVSGTSADRWELGTNISQTSSFELYNRATSASAFHVNSSNDATFTGNVVISGGDGLKINTTSDLQTSSEKFSLNGLGVIRNSSDSAATLYIQNHSTTASTIQPYIFLADSGGNRGGLGVETSTAKVTLNGQGGIRFTTGSSGVGGTQALLLDTSQNATFAGTITAGSNISVPASSKILLDGASGHTYIKEEGDNNMKFYVGASEHANFGGGNIYLAKPTYIDGIARSRKNIVSNSTYNVISLNSSRGTDDYGGLNKDYMKIDLVTPGPDTDGGSSAHGLGNFSLKLADDAGSTAMQEVLNITPEGIAVIPADGTVTKRFKVAPGTDYGRAHIGRAALGKLGWDDHAGFAHEDHNGQGGYALLQDSAGNTYLNTPASKTLSFRKNNSNMAYFGTTGTFVLANHFAAQSTATISGYTEIGNDTANVSNDGSWNARLNVAGTHHARIDVRENDDDIIATLYAHTGHDAARVGTLSSHKLEFLSGNNVRGTIATNGDYTAVGDVVAYSDKKLKKNIKTLDGSKVYDMRGVSFTRKDSGKDGSGVIAQELQKIAPELITETDNTLGVAYGNLTGYLIEAIKDLKAEVEELKKQIK